MNGTSPTYFQDIGKLILRLSVAGLLLCHGVNKITNGIGWLPPALANQGMPEWLAYGVFVGEVLGPAILIIGFWTRLGALLICGNMVFAIVIAHANDVWKLNPMSGGWAIELDALYFFGSLAVFFLGSGLYSLSKGKGVLS